MLREYGFQIVVPSIAVQHPTVLPDALSCPTESLVRAYALGQADKIDKWVLRHKNLRVDVERDFSSRAYEVNFVVTYEDKEESPHSNIRGGKEC